MIEIDRVCKQCGETKLIVCFAVAPYQRGGRCVRCKGCNAKACADAARARSADPERYRGYTRKWQALNREIRNAKNRKLTAELKGWKKPRPPRPLKDAPSAETVLRRARRRASYQLNRATELERQAEYRAAHPEKMTSRSRRYRAAHAEQIKQHQKEHREAKRAAQIQLSLMQLQTIQKPT